MTAVRQEPSVGNILLLVLVVALLRAGHRSCVESLRPKGLLEAHPHRPAPASPIHTTWPRFTARLPLFLKGWAI